MTVETVTVSVDSLAHFARDIFLALGLEPDEAALCADGLMQSELRCLPGQMQGVGRLPVYRQRIREGLVTPGAPFEILRESPSIALVDAHNALGHVSGFKAMQLAVAKAKATGVGQVIVRHSSHFGSAGVHARRAVSADCMGIAISNAGPEMAPWGGTTPVLGTNPWAIAAPTNGPFPLVLDMAVTTAGKGMMMWLARDGRKMPLDWAITRDGRTTDEPTEAMDGTLLPIGGPKGYGLSLMTDVLTGVLGGAAFGSALYKNPAFQDVGHLFMAYDIEWFMPVNEFKSRLDALLSEIQASNLRPGVEQIYLPGELEYLREQDKLQNGVRVERQSFEELRQLAADLKVEFPARES